MTLLPPGTREGGYVCLCTACNSHPFYDKIQTGTVKSLALIKFISLSMGSFERAAIPRSNCK